MRLASRRRATTESVLERAGRRPTRVRWNCVQSPNWATGNDRDTRRERNTHIDTVCVLGGASRRVSTTGSIENSAARWSRVGWRRRARGSLECVRWSRVSGEPAVDLCALESTFLSHRYGPNWGLWKRSQELRALRTKGRTIPCVSRRQAPRQHHAAKGGVFFLERTRRRNES